VKDSVSRKRIRKAEKRRALDKVKEDLKKADLKAADKKSGKVPKIVKKPREERKTKVTFNLEE
jgi:hypothetical protein